MKLTFKDLSQQKFTIDIEPSETIADVKSKVAAERKSDASLLKLIYSGKILQDDKTVESYKIEEKGFVVVMTNKVGARFAFVLGLSSYASQPKPAAASAAAPPATPAPAAAAQTPAAPPAPAPAAASNTTAAPGTPSPAPAAARAGGAFGGDSGMAVGMEERNRAIADMESMGFPRADIDRAMRAAFYNPDRAVEYLLNGIPESALQEERSRQIPASAAAGNTQPQQQAQQPAQAGTGGEEPLNLFEAAAQGGGRGAATGGNRGAEARPGSAPAANLDFLRNNPQFQQLRQVVQQQPQMLEPILQQVAAGNPQVAQIIAQHPDQFMQLLAEDADDDAALPPGAQPISVTEEERDAIERLCRLGFEREMVIQAYFACDKNEELAANFLFDQPEDPEEQ
ncbi:UV excision repair protein rhp23 [Sphaceloma murrayae]|uniref:UV excision repair protein RAD23 n=1 Tax=Sphaceloma murrayae TaxID=2082308 RepID=A0A2K1QI06_9PEZI|nr:UV excision repair protein rhp23 [Sphaceloma murrayae]